MYNMLEIILREPETIPIIPSGILKYLLKMQELNAVPKKKDHCFFFVSGKNICTKSKIKKKTKKKHSDYGKSNFIYFLFSF